MSLNVEFLRTKIDERYRGVEEFAPTVGVTRQAVYGWLSGKAFPDEARILKIVTSLDLNEREINRLLGLPQTELCFRKTGLKSPAPEVQARSYELADTFFKIGGPTYLVKEPVLSGAKSDVRSVASYIRKSLLNADQDEPIKLSELLIELQKHNVNVFFLPFRKLGLVLEASSHREVAFTARKGDRLIIFIDADRTRDEAIFDICHELAHIVSNREGASPEEERFCNQVAQELIYPEKYLLERKESLSALLDGESSLNTIAETFKRFFQDFDWSPKGLAIALNQLRLMSSGSGPFTRLMRFNKMIERKTINDLFFSDFRPDDAGSLKRFFSEIQRDKEIYKPLIEIRDATAFGRLSVRRLSELLNMDIQDAEDIAAVWTETEPSAS